MVNWTEIKERLADAKDKAFCRFAYDGMSYNIQKDGDKFLLRDDYSGRLLYAAKGIGDISRNFYHIHRYGIGR